MGDYVISFNGLTGAVQGVSAAIGGTGISVSGATGAITITNTGVHTINGATGAITNVAKTNVDNYFTESQSILGSTKTLTVYDSNTENSLILNPAEQCLTLYDSQQQGTLKLEFPQTGDGFTITLPDYTTTLAGLSGTQTFGGVNTFSGLAQFTAGISAAGGTFSALTRFTAGISAAGATFSGNISAPNIVNSFNGLTGAVTGVTTGTANTFGPLQSFTNGISAAGATFSGLAQFIAGISAAGGDITFNSNVTIDYQSTLNVRNIANPYGPIRIGDPDGVNTGNYISYEEGDGVLSGGGGNNIVDFNNISCDTITINKLPHLTSAVFESKTANWTPTDADNGKIFVVNISGKSTITCTLNGLSVGVSFKIFVQSGTVAFSVTGTGYGSALALGNISGGGSTTIYCTASNTYFGTSSG